MADLSDPETAEILENCQILVTLMLQQDEEAGYVHLSNMIDSPKAGLAIPMMASILMALMVDFARVINENHLSSEEVTVDMIWRAACESLADPDLRN